jgi:dihydroxy-acid dehydratase
MTSKTTKQLRSQEWFNNPHNPGMTALYLERYLNYGLTRDELQSGKPIIGIAQTGSDLSPCNRHHIELAKRVLQLAASRSNFPAIPFRKPASARRPH